MADSNDGTKKAELDRETELQRQNLLLEQIEQSLTDIKYFAPLFFRAAREKILIEPPFLQSTTD